MSDKSRSRAGQRERTFGRRWKPSLPDLAPVTSAGLRQELRAAADRHAALKRSRGRVAT